MEIDNDCGDLVFSAGHGDSCLITNTVFFEGIPTLSQYGMAILTPFRFYGSNQGLPAKRRV